ncbi:MAG: hypothetical protein JWN38_743 [Candidatus Saccharibacteria bacterium]|nr:hypothetical protein [Candidatus Saccharibacteria bacterium]
MAEKKIPISASPSDENVEERVDAIMEDETSSVSGEPRKINVSKYQPSAKLTTGVRTAPEVPGKKSKAAEPATADDSSSDNAPAEAAGSVTIDQLFKAAADEDGATPLDDKKTDEAIDEIAATDSDDLLAAEDEAKKTGSKRPLVTGGKRRFFKRKLFWAAVVIVLLAIIFGLPVTRYKAVGLVVKKSVTVTVIDNSTKQPVSDATLTIGSKSITTNAKGVATIKSGVGSHDVSISKQYYAPADQAVFIGILSAANARISLTPTGRQVPVTVVDKVSGQPLAGAEIHILNTSAKTNAKGKATIVLPAKSAKLSAKFSAKGYNDLSGQVEVTASVVAANTFAVVPTGQVYFLSNQNGTIDVVKSNLDGSEPKTVLKGTGKEDRNDTVLLAARDWKYVVLKAKRDTDQAAMYLIDTSTDKVTEFDSGSASFTPIGWYGHDFMYDVARDTVPTSQNGHEVIKSYDADRSQLNQLDATQVDADKAGTAGALYQSFYNFYILNNQLVYSVQWYSSTSSGGLSAKTDVIRSVQPNGQSKKDLHSENAGSVSYISAALAAPQEAYFGFAVYSTSTSGYSTTYVEYANQTAKVTTDISDSDFTKGYPTYLLSPSGKKSLWSEQRNGKATPLIGDDSAQNGQPQTSLIGYSAYGWFSDDYVLLTKNGSELYIASATNPKSAIKLADYYKPDHSFAGYGYGYGGL